MYFTNGQKQSDMTGEEFSFTTQIRFLINRLLSPIGIQVSTSVKEKKEKKQLIKLKEKGHWKEQKYSKGLKIIEEKYFQFLNEICFPFQGEFLKFHKTNSTSDSNDYYLNNEFFSTIDAEVLYSIIRHFKPQNIIEVGSGFSTRLMRLAINEGNLETNIICIDPQPRVDILNHVDEHFALRVEDLETDKLLNKIKGGDILFIDSSHIVTTGGDVTLLFLEVLPELPAGVLVHIHDIYLPFDYPEDWVINERWGWNEQYLVQAFLMFNDSFEIIWPSHYMWIRHANSINEIFTQPVNNYKPSSLWIKKVK